MGNGPEEISKGSKNTKPLDRLPCARLEAALYIFTSVYNMISCPPVPSPASLAADVLHHWRADTSGWEYSSSTNSLGIQTVPTHWLLEDKKPGLRWELTENGRKMELGVMVMADRWFSIRKKKDCFLLEKNALTVSQILHKQSSGAAHWPFLTALTSSWPTLGSSTRRYHCG